MWLLALDVFVEGEVVGEADAVEGVGEPFGVAVG
jgi:hypothetical protein